MAKKEAHVGFIFGCWAMIISVLIAFIAAALPVIPSLVLVLITLGIIIGLSNFMHPETEKFLLGNIALLVTATAVLTTGFERLAVVSPGLTSYFKMTAFNIIAITAPATLIIALKNLYELTK